MKEKNVKLVSSIAGLWLIAGLAIILVQNFTVTQAIIVPGFFAKQIPITVSFVSFLIVIATMVTFGWIGIRKNSGRV